MVLRGEITLYLRILLFLRRTDTLLVVLYLFVLNLPFYMLNILNAYFYFIFLSRVIVHLWKEAKLPFKRTNDRFCAQLISYHLFVS